MQEKVECCLFLEREYKYLSCVPGVDGKIHPEGVVQHRRWRGLPSHRLAARSPIVNQCCQKKATLIYSSVFHSELARAWLLLSIHTKVVFFILRVDLLEKVLGLSARKNLSKREESMFSYDKVHLTNRVPKHKIRPVFHLYGSATWTWSVSVKRDGKAWIFTLTLFHLSG